MIGLKKVVLRAPHEVEVLEQANGRAQAPDPTRDALVCLRLAGMCGSDLAAFRGQSPQVSYPRVLGHELLVDVIECAARPDLVGGRAVVEPLLACGACRVCRAGRYNCCPRLRVLGVHVDGGMQTNFEVPASQLYPVADALSDDAAVLAEPLSVAYRAVQRSEIGAGETAVVLGAGPIGLLIAQLLMRARGCRVFTIDTDRSRLELAERLGVTPIQPQDTGGEMAACVFEATGAPACVRMATDLVRTTGRIVLVGWSHAPVEVDTITLMRKEAEIVGTRNSTCAFEPVLRLLEDGVVDAGAMITHHVAFDQVPEALRMLDRGEPAVKVVVAP